MTSEKFLHIKKDDRIRLITPIKDGYIELPLLSQGRIVHTNNLVEAEIWFYDMGLEYWDNQIRKLLDTKQKLRGIVLNIKKEYFAVVYHYPSHCNIQIDSRKAVEIPFFKETNYLKKIESNWYINNVRGTEYVVSQLIDVVSDGFTEWVEKNLKSRKVFKYEKESGEFPDWIERTLTDESSKRYYQRREELELKFAQVTGLYYEFLGGLHFE